MTKAGSSTTGRMCSTRVTSSWKPLSSTPGRPSLCGEVVIHIHVSTANIKNGHLRTSPAQSTGCHCYTNKQCSGVPMVTTVLTLHPSHCLHSNFPCGGPDNEQFVCLIVLHAGGGYGEAVVADLRQGRTWTKHATHSSHRHARPPQSPRVYSTDTQVPVYTRTCGAQGGTTLSKLQRTACYTNCLCGPVGTRGTKIGQPSLPPRSTAARWTMWHYLLEHNAAVLLLVLRQIRSAGGQTALAHRLLPVVLAEAVLPEPVQHIASSSLSLSLPSSRYARAIGSRSVKL